MKNKSRVLYITPGCYDKGGISRYNGYQIRALQSIVSDENLKVVSLFGPEQDGLDIDFEVNWHGKGPDIFSKIGLLWYCFCQVLIFRPDMIWVGHVNFSGFAKFFAFLSNAKVVLNVYGLEVWGKLTLDAKWGLKHAHYIISDCHFTAAYLEDTGLRPKGTTTVIWDCVDLDKFKPVQNGFEHIRDKYQLPDRNHNLIILSLGRLAQDAAYKGYERLLIAFSQAKYTGKVCLVYAGRGNLIPHLKEVAMSLGIQERVFFTGSVDEADMAAMYSFAHVFSLISHRDDISGEGIPLTPLEALACGVPVLVGNQDGSQEAVIDHRNGVILDPFDLALLTRTLDELMMNDEKRLQLQSQARKVAEEYFSYESFRNKHDQFLKQVLS